MQALVLAQMLECEAGEVWISVVNGKARLFVGDKLIALLALDQVQSRELSIAGNLTLNTYTRQASCNDQFVSLTKTEFDILRVLIENRHRVMTYKMLIELFHSMHAIEQHVHALRLKLRTAGWNGRIATIRGVGLRIET